MPQNPITSLPPLPGTEWDPDNPGQLRRIKKPERGEFDIPKPIGGVGTFDPSKPSEVKNVLDITRKPPENIVTETLSTGKEIKFKLDTPAKVAAYSEWQWRKKNRQEDREIAAEKRGIAADAREIAAEKRKFDREDDLEASIFNLIDRMGETIKSIEGFPQPKHSEKTIAGLQNLLQGKIHDLQKLRGTESVPTVGGDAPPGMTTNPYVIFRESQLGVLDKKTDHFIAPDGTLKSADKSGKPAQLGQEPAAGVAPRTEVKPKPAAIIPKKDSRAKTEPKKSVDPALRKVEKRKLTVKLGKLTKELRTSPDNPRLLEEIARIKAEIKALTKPHQHHAGMKM